MLHTFYKIRLDIVTIDALSNIVNLCEYVFQENYSYIKRCTCEICGNIKIVKKCILPVNEEILNKHGYAKIIDAIKEGKVLKLRCSKCDKERSMNVSYGAQLFIESSIITALEDIPLSIQLNEQNYTHVGCVVYHGQHPKTSVGHYTAYVRNGTNWIEYDDMLRKPKKVCAKVKRDVNTCIYIET